MFCFGILRFLEKNRKSAKTGKSRHFQAPTPQHREPTPRRRHTLRRGIPCHSEAEVPKWHPSGTTWHSYCS